MEGRGRRWRPRFFFLSRVLMMGNGDEDFRCCWRTGGVCGCNLQRANPETGRRRRPQPGAWQRPLQRELGHDGAECRRFGRGGRHPAGRRSGRAGVPRLQAEIAKRSDKPVKSSINTHWHFDHVGGNALCRRQGAITIAQTNTRTRLMSASRSSPINGGNQPAFAPAFWPHAHLRRRIDAAFQRRRHRRDPRAQRPHRRRRDRALPQGQRAVRRRSLQQWRLHARRCARRQSGRHDRGLSQAAADA